MKTVKYRNVAKQEKTINYVKQSAVPGQSKKYVTVYNSCNNDVAHYLHLKNIKYEYVPAK